MIRFEGVAISIALHFLVSSVGCSSKRVVETRPSDAGFVSPQEPERGWVLKDTGYLEPIIVIDRDRTNQTATVRSDDGQQSVIPADDIVQLSSGKLAYMATDFEFCAVDDRRWQACIRTRHSCLLPTGEHCTDRTTSAYGSIGRLRMLWPRLVLRESIARAKRTLLPVSRIPNDRLHNGMKVLAPQDERWGVATFVKRSHELCTVRVQATRLQFPLPCEQLALLPPEPSFAAEVGKLVLVRPSDPNDLWWPIAVIISVPDVGIDVVDGEGASRRVSIDDVVGLSEKATRDKEP